MELTVPQLKALMEIFAELDTPSILRKSVSNVSQIMDARGCSIFLYDESSHCIELSETTGIDFDDQERVIYKEGEGLTGWVFAHRQSLLIQDFDNKSDKDLQALYSSEISWTGKYTEGAQRQKPKSFLAVPIITNDVFYGIIRAASDDKNFTDSDKEILVRVAHYIGIALLNSKHFLQERKKGDYLELLMQFGARLHSYYNLKDLLKFVAEQTANTFSAESCEIYFIDKENRSRLVLRAGHGVPESLIDKAEHEIGEGLTGTLVRENRTIRLNNVLEYKKYKGKYRKQMKKNLQYGDRLAFLGIPISVKTDVIGCLKLYNKIPRYVGGQTFFSEDDEKYLQVLGELLSIAIENLQYLESMQTSVIQMFKTQRLTALGTVAIRLPNEVTNPLTTSQLQIKNILRKIKKSNGSLETKAISKTIEDIDGQLKEVANGIKVLQDFSTKAGFVKVEKTWQEILDEGILFLSDEILRKKINIRRNKAAELRIPKVKVEPNEMIEVIINLLILTITPLKHYNSGLKIRVKHHEKKGMLMTTFTSCDNIEGTKMTSQVIATVDDSEILTPQQFMFNVAKEIVHNNYGGTIESNAKEKGATIKLTLPIGDDE